MVIVEGIGPGDEERSLAYLKAEVNGIVYDWQAYVPVGMGVQEFEAWVAPMVTAEIQTKEAAWVSAPKTREIEDPITGEKTTVPVDKSEIVRPEIPDYYARRRAEYPTLAEQLGALWKGGDAATAMAAKVQSVKDKYPKP